MEFYFTQLLFWYSDYPRFDSWELFRIAFLSFWHLCIIRWELPWILIKDISGLSLTFSAQALESSIFPRSSASFYWRLVFRNQDLGAQCAHCCKAVISRPSQWTDLGNTWMFTYTQWTRINTHAFISICLSVYYLSIWETMSSHWDRKSVV